MSYFKLFVLSFLLVFLSGCGTSEAPEQKKMLIYCGITMIKPMKQLAEEFEKTNNVKITLIQGGSQDLYDSLKMSQTGDLYLPGSPNYRINNEADGLLKEHVLLGYNRIAIMVAEGNPKQITDDLNQFTDKKLSTVLSNPETGSVGKASLKILQKHGIAEQAYDNTLYLTTDSRRLMDSMKNKEADLILNWYATATWPDNKDLVDVIELPKSVSKPRELELNLTKFSTEPELAKQFMSYASGPRGLEVFKQFGFLTEPEYQDLMANK